LAVAGLDDMICFSDPLFRLASPEEVEANRLDVPPNHTAFCIVTAHGRGADESPILIVARAAQIVESRSVR